MKDTEALVVAIQATREKAAGLMGSRKRLQHMDEIQHLLRAADTCDRVLGRYLAAAAQDAGAAGQPLPGNGSVASAKLAAK